MTLFTFVTAFTPGPNNIMVTASGVNFGFARTIPHMAGITIGFMVMVAAVNLRSDIVGDNSGMLFAPAANTLNVAPSLWACSGIAQTADNGATTVEGPQVQYVVDWIWGLMQLWPGTLMCVGAAVAISTTYTVGVYGLVLPKPDFA